MPPDAALSSKLETRDGLMDSECEPLQIVPALHEIAALRKERDILNAQVQLTIMFRIGRTLTVPSCIASARWWI
jgi:hypothetical protein